MNIEEKSDAREQRESLPVDMMKSLSARQCRALKALWIISVQSFVACAATEEGRHGLSKLLDLTTEALAAILKEAKDLLGENNYRTLITPKAGGRLGALFEETENAESLEEPPGGEKNNDIS